MTKPYLSELKEQLRVIQDRIAALEDKAYAGAFGPRFATEDKEKAAELLKRKREVEDAIVNWRP